MKKLNQTLQSKLFKKKFNQKYPKLNLDYLEFLQDQNEVRKSKTYPNPITDSKERTSEFLVLVMCWNEYLKTVGGLYHCINEDAYKDVWIQTKEYHDLLVKEDEE